MSSLKPQTVLYRRKRQKKTNYKKRLRLLLARKPRLVVRLTNKNILAQLVAFAASGDKIVLGVNSSSLKANGWPFSAKNLPAAYLTGLMVGASAVKQGYTKAVLDTGMRLPIKKGRIYAFLKGALDAGMQIPYKDDSIFPSWEKISGNNIAEYIASAKKATPQQFAQYLKSDDKAKQLQDTFEKVRKKLMEK